MKVYYFKNQDIEDYIRDENGVIVTDEDGRSKTTDYYSIQLKVPKSDCSIDFRTYARYSAFALFPANEVPGEGNADIEMCRKIVKELMEDGLSHIEDNLKKWEDHDKN